MRLTLRAGVVAAPFALALLAGCWDDKIPTKQIGGTEYGVILNAVSPARLPSAAFTATAVTGQASTLNLLTVTLSNFKPLLGPAAYRFYAVGATTGDTVPVAARLTALRRDTTVSATGAIVVTTDSSEIGTSTFFRGAPPNTDVRARFAGAQFGGTSRAFLVVTIQADSTQPTFTAATPRPVWLRYRNAATPFAILASGASSFGTFDIAAPRIYSALGRGRSAFWDRNRDEKLLYSAIADNLTQPPLGYYYQPWLRDTRTRRAVRFGELTDDAGHSLKDADLLSIPGAVAQLPRARFGTSEAEIGQPLMTFDGVHLVLEPKAGDPAQLSLVTILLGTVGDTLGFRGLGALSVRVKRGNDSIPNASILVVPVGSNLAIGEPKPAVTLDTTATNKTQKGRAIITKIPAGAVDIFVTPPGGTTPVDTTRVIVVRRDTTEVTVNLP